MAKKPIELKIIGEGQEKKNLIELVKKYNLQNIYFLGEIFDELFQKRYSFLICVFLQVI